MYKDYSFVFDIDGTLCPIKKKTESYEDLVPYSDVVEKLRYYRLSSRIILRLASRLDQGRSQNLPT